MVDDLMRTQLDVGMSVDDVLGLLGPPSWRKYEQGESYLRYDMGTCGDLVPLDEYFLYVHYDARGVIERVRVGE